MNKYYNFQAKTRCTLKYTSLNKLLTKTKFPFFELENCQNVSCKIGEYRCREKHYCIPINKICDGIFHCYFGDDENLCSKNKIIQI